MALHATASHVTSKAAVIESSNVSMLYLLVFVLPSEVSWLIHVKSTLTTSIVTIIPALSLSVAEVPLPRFAIESAPTL